SGLRSKKQPISFSSSRTRSTAFVTKVQARSWLGSHLPPSMVSMKWRSTESPLCKATLYPPWTIRVQPDFPSKPFVAIVIVACGAAWSAWSAANSPAPPEPRIRMSVFVRSSMGASEDSDQEDECGEHSSGADCGRGDFLDRPPGDGLEVKNTQTAEQMNGQQKDKPGFGELHHRLLGPSQEAIETRLTFDCQAQREEVKRQKAGESNAGKAMHLGRDPKPLATMSRRAPCFDLDAHGITTAITARHPRMMSSKPKPHMMPSSARARSEVHSRRTERSPM